MIGLVFITKGHPNKYQYLLNGACDEINQLDSQDNIKIYHKVNPKFRHKFWDRQFATESAY